MVCDSQTDRAVIFREISNQR